MLQKTAASAQTMLTSGTVGVGQRYLLGLERSGAPVQTTVIADKW